MTMAALLSSPMMSSSLYSAHNLTSAALERRFDAFDQPTSPTAKQTDLPREFADQSFGSSMSLGSSFELNRLAASGAVIGGNGFKTTIQIPSVNVQPSFQAVRQSPNRKKHKGLGAAMGTTLNSKSPGLAAKMSTLPQYMDLSPVPVNVAVVRKVRSSLLNTRQSDSSTAFQLAGASLLATLKGEDMSLSSADANLSIADCSIEDASPSMMRNAARKYATISGSSRSHLPDVFNVSGSPVAPSSRSSYRPGMLRRPSKDDSSPLGYGKRYSAGTVTAASIKTIDECPPRSPYASGGQGMLTNETTAGCLDHNMPGFGASEREGKILPCFNVKDDGLMRITPDTLMQVLQGNFDEITDGFQIVDCRFGYEFDGGHIPGAINLSTLEKVKRHFLQPTNPSVLPLRTQSGKADARGNARKKLIIFHCEFSAKRAPSSALALRQADRSLAHDYPNCHYPEVYVLQGGYCAFYKSFANVCEPRAYVQMDDPKYVQKRSVELNGFRKQFARHKSFAYGDNNCRQTQSDDQLFKRAERDRTNNSSKSRLPSALGRFIKEEEDSTSFDNSGSSPSAAQADAVLARRRGMTRHATSAGVLGFAGGLALQPAGGRPPSRLMTSTTTTSSTAANTLGFRPILGTRDENKEEPTCIGDLSFGSSCSIADDTFDASVGAIAESPCAALTGQGRKTHSRLAPGPR